MIGIGKWEATVQTMMFSKRIIVEIKNDNGKYAFDYQLPQKYRNTKIKIYDIKEINGNTLVAVGETSLLPGKRITAQITFKGNFLYGFVKAPVMGGITLMIKNGRRIG